MKGNKREVHQTSQTSVTIKIKLDKLKISKFYSHQMSEKVVRGLQHIFPFQLLSCMIIFHLIYSLVNKMNTVA